ncbi:MAG TPA: hypothetical protein PLV06_09260 [Bacteroidales bacterium]|nr:hypothetical protein [Bacteroidales bacterium]HPJ59785.1 hypothetical protein [Bacteroidales bacterium]HPR12558.1 hypothetical protein [Bacteroidales bacterium]HRW85241.1 hypothetical protein [Bacteroidales bacterium]
MSYFEKFFDPGAGYFLEASSRTRIQSRASPGSGGTKVLCPDENRQDVEQSFFIFILSVSVYIYSDCILW